MTEDSRNWKRYTRRGALGLMGIGAVGVASETLGYTQLTSGRGLSVTVDEDNNASLKIVDENNQDTTIDNASFTGSANIRFENNGGTDISNITGSISGDTGDASLSSNDFSVDNTADNFNLADGSYTTPLGTTNAVNLTIDNTTTGTGSEQTISIGVDITGLIDAETESNSSVVLDLNTRDISIDS